MTQIRVPAWSKMFAGLLWCQGIYYLLTGIWPLVSVRTFIWVTGDKGKTDHQETGLETDHWLIMTVGVLVTAVSVTLLTAAWRKTQGIELAVLAIGAALGLTAIDLIYTAREVIGPMYLLDAAIESGLIAMWAVALFSRVRPGQS